MRTANQILQSIIADVEAMRTEGQYWFGPFDESDTGKVYWPNLGILMDEAKSGIASSAGENQRLRELLAEAWQIGANHERPTFEQLNAWREAATAANDEMERKFRQQQNNESFTFEKALRVCAKACRDAGQPDAAKVYEDSANMEAKRKAKEVKE